MSILADLFTFSFLFKAGALVFSFVAIIFTIQLYANINQVSKSILTKRNIGIRLISFLFIIISALLFISALFIL